MAGLHTKREHVAGRSPGIKVATATLVLAGSADGQFVLSVDYDDVTRIIQTVKLVNNSALAGFVQASRDVGGVYYTRTLAAGGSETVSVVGLNLTLPLPTALEGSLAGLSMFNITTRWPA
jgi:hypothetical protein